ncbi:hypothetical protein V494_08582 [Pseudogymnoascus sp. VKM F-4513 (FW-928)]|nr:hypothetical protein V494_08582 [Pseudogymnoascus sp. VKM F-4513 (FW-928)]
MQLFLLSALVASTSATGILLPLYVYPALDFDDGASAWAPVRDAVTANPSVEWQVVVNPHNGPGISGLPGDDDVNYISGTAQFNALPNVRTIGYVRTLNGAAPLPEVQANITAWAAWSTYAASDISVHGIFFDETIEPSGISDGSNLEYLTSATNFARQAFGSTPIVTICNFGAKPDARYYDICDEVVVFESCLNNNAGDPVCTTAPLPPQYEDQATINANIPDTTKAGQAAVIVHDFVGTTYDGQPADVSTLKSYITTLKSNLVGWAYFSSSGYGTITATPVTVGALASAFV